MKFRASVRALGLSGSGTDIAANLSCPLMFLLTARHLPWSVKVENIAADEACKDGRTERLLALTRQYIDPDINRIMLE